MAIEDLKKNAIDPVSITIGGSSNNAPKPSVGPNAIKPKITTPEEVVTQKTVIKPKNANANKEERVTIDLTNLAQPKTPKGVEVRESPIKDILDTNNPDSPFSKYLNRKEAEMDEYLTELDHQQELAENDFIDENGVNTADDGAVIGVESIANIEESNEGSTVDMSEYNISTEDTNSLKIDITGGSTVEDEPVDVIEDDEEVSEEVSAIDDLSLDEEVEENDEVNMDEELEAAEESIEENIMENSTPAVKVAP